MNLTKLFSFAITLLVLFSACNDNQYDGVEIPREARPSGEITLSLLDATGVLTRSVEEKASELGTEAERKIFDLVFYIFEQNGARDIDFPVYIPQENANSRFTFPVTEGTKRILVAINTGEKGRAISETAGYEAVKTALYENIIADPTHVVNESTKTGIPMSGEVAGVEVSEGEITSTMIEVSRLYARFNAPNGKSATVQIDTDSDDYEELVLLNGGNPIDGNLKFSLTGYIVANGLKKSYFFPNYGVANPDKERWSLSSWTIGGDQAHYTASAYNNENKLGTVYSGDRFLGVDDEDVVYLYENSPRYYSNTETGTISGFYRDRVYAMIIEGELSDNNGLIATRYWRINVSNTKDTESMFQIIRNAIYKVNIDTVKTIGYGTPGEAEEGGGEEVIPGADDASVAVTVKLLDWRVFEENTDI